jgi:AcrR family transcriptional regulator
VSTVEIHTVHQVEPGPGPETRGRPRIHEDGEILEAALHAFAAQGYEAMSLRALNAQLGLSHGTISQRFGTKERLFFAAIDQGFASFVEEVDRLRAHLLAAVDGTDELEDLRVTIRAFLGAAHRHPELGRLVNQEGLQSTGRLNYFVETVILPLFGTIGSALDQLRLEGRIRPVTMRSMFFLIGNGAGAPFTLTALSDAFAAPDGPLDPEQHADDMTDLIMRGITLSDADAPEGATSALRALAGPQPKLSALSTT